MSISLAIYDKHLNAKKLLENFVWQVQRLLYNDTISDGQMHSADNTRAALVQLHSWKYSNNTSQEEFCCCVGRVLPYTITNVPSTPNAPDGHCLLRFSRRASRSASASERPAPPAAAAAACGCLAPAPFTPALLPVAGRSSTEASKKITRLHLHVTLEYGMDQIINHFCYDTPSINSN